jgi:hypothetical protein
MCSLFGNEMRGIDFLIVDRFTQQNILRVYPKGTRITSSNYNPLIGWMHGAQMVAFNMQVFFLFSKLQSKNL